MEETKKTRNANIGLYAIIAVLVLAVVTFFAVPSLYPIFFWTFIVVQVAFAVVLSFDGFRNYSQYGLSRNHIILNHLLSVTAVAIPFLSLFFSAPYLLTLAFLLNGLSMLRSPAVNPDQPEKLSLRHPASHEFLKAGLWAMIYIVVVFYAFLQTDKAEMAKPIPEASQPAVNVQESE